MSRTETFWKPCTANNRSAAANTSSLVWAWVSGSGSVRTASVTTGPGGEPAASPHQLAHRLVETFDGQREHAIGGELAHHLDRGGVVPVPLADRVEPDDAFIELR